MLVLTHALSGGALGQIIGIPIWAFLAGIILHFVLDKLPHFWPQNKKSKGFLMAVDGIFTIFFILLFIYQDIGNINGFLAGACGGIVVDLLMIYTPLYDKKIGQWHTKRQPHLKNFLFFITDIIIIIISVGLIIYPNILRGK